MKIPRLRVTGGFLSGIDLRFDDGLNVLIGGRGAGKTTVLELMRFALGLEFADKRRMDGQQTYISAVLGKGEIVLDLLNDGIAERIVVDATGEGRRVDLRAPAVMVSQNETEAIASDPDSRLRLIDLRADVDSLETTPGAIFELTVQLQTLQAQIDQAREQSSRLPDLQAQHSLAASREAIELEKAGGKHPAMNEELREIETGLVDADRLRSRIAYLLEQVQRGEVLTTELGSLAVELTDSSNGLPTTIVASANQVVLSLRKSRDDIEKSFAALRTEASSENALLANREQAGRLAAEPLRTELMSSRTELAQLTTEVGTLNREIERLTNLAEQVSVLRSTQATVRASRGAMLEKRENSREDLYSARLAVAESVNSRLANRVTIALDHYGDTRAFRTFLTTQLKNKGLQYSALIDSILAAYLPLNLLRVLEERDGVAVSKKLKIPQERADRLIDALYDADALGQLANIEAADLVDYRLRDGHELKSVEHLSTGQKCAVTLPILLTDFERTLLLDQPEDHLDNAYLVTNVVSALNERTASGAQTIVATHNANIPVLGNAGMVIALDSDGSQGHVTGMGNIDDLDVVRTISKVMEGGAEAFRRRAEFYRSHGLAIN